MPAIATTLISIQIAAVPFNCAQAPPAPAAPPDPPSVSSAVRLARPGGLIEWHAAESLGIGHLRPADDIQMWPIDRSWGFPVYQSPKGSAIGWLINGWWITGVNRTALGFAGTLETGYEIASYVVFEQRLDGWLKVRFASPRDRRDSIGWVHACHLTLTETPIMFERWEQRFLSASISPLFFRSELTHMLRDAPSGSGARVKRIAGSHHLEPLEIRGDWMRVRVVQPSDYCAEPGKVESSRAEGWVQWRSDDRGTWVWYYTRGC